MSETRMSGVILRNILLLALSFSSPEEINDSPETAPSKRVEALIPGYQKPLMGTLAALEIGLEKIRDACPHFNNWLSQIEAFGLLHPA